MYNENNKAKLYSSCGTQVCQAIACLFRTSCLKPPRGSTFGTNRVVHLQKIVANHPNNIVVFGPNKGSGRIHQRHAAVDNAGDAERNHRLRFTKPFCGQGQEVRAQICEEGGPPRERQMRRLQMRL